MQSPIVSMRARLLSFLKHYPSLHHFVQSSYWKLLSLRASILGTKIEEKRWAKRNLNEVKKGFSNLNHPSRQLLLEKISAFQPISDALEVGCDYGPNLYLLARQFPKSKLIGIDVNPLSIQEGNKWFTQQDISNVKLLVGKADELDQFWDKNFDIVFTDAVLIYIGPDKIKKTIEDMIRITRKALILVEWHCERQSEDSNGLGVYHFGCWKRDYVDLIEQFVPRNQIRLTKIPRDLWPTRNWDKLGYIIEVIL